MITLTNPKLMSPGEVCEILGIHPATLYRWRARGKPLLPAVKVGRLLKYRPQDVDALLSRSEREVSV
jgi:excisionase family DNA binding protein